MRAHVHAHVFACHLHGCACTDVRKYAYTRIRTLGESESLNLQTLGAHVLACHLHGRVRTNVRK